MFRYEDYHESWERKPTCIDPTLQYRLNIQKPLSNQRQDSLKNQAVLEMLMAVNCTRRWEAAFSHLHRCACCHEWSQNWDNEISVLAGRKKEGILSNDISGSAKFQAAFMYLKCNPTGSPSSEWCRFYFVILAVSNIFNHIFSPVSRTTLEATARRWW